MDIDTFAERIVRLNPGNLQSSTEVEPRVTGAPNGSGDAVFSLQRAALEFARLYKNDAPFEDLQAARRDIISKIMVAVALEAIGEAKADELIAALSQLMKERKA